MEDSAQKAIHAALSGDWVQAIVINQGILKEDPQDVDALNRLAKALFEIGETKKAKVTSAKVLLINPHNTIAKKLLDKCSLVTINGHLPQANVISPQAFLEEPGKTKLVDLIHLGDSKLIATLDAGDNVELTCHEHRVSVTTADGKYIGRLPDDLAARLKKLIKNGTDYQTLIKSADKNVVRVFIREIGGDGLSFPSEHLDYVALNRQLEEDDVEIV